MSGFVANARMYAVAPAAEDAWRELLARAAAEAGLDLAYVPYPAPRPLERYAIRVADDGQVEIDKSRAFQEELGQWADAESFVTV